MFLVRVQYPADDAMPMCDQKLEQLVGRRSDAQGIIGLDTGQNVRQLLWEIEDFDRALSLRRRLSALAGVKANLREK